MNLTTTQWAGTHLPCPCGKSSDAYSLNEEGDGHCFSCDKHFFAKEKHIDETRYSVEYVPWRGVTRETMEFYNTLTKVDGQANGKPVSIGFPYEVADAEEPAYKVRMIDNKQFVSHGPMAKASCFGTERFHRNSAKAITITEGEMDAMSAFQMLGSKYPVISVRSSSSAKKDCAAIQDYLESFEKIYLCLDNDEMGEKAMKSIATLFDFNKVYHVKMDSKLKDANGYLQAGMEKAFKDAWWSATRFIPEGIYSSKQEFKKLLDDAGSRVSFEYPFPTLNRMLEGIAMGETVLITALEGRGKTEIIRAIEYKILKDDPTAKIGVIHLEETQARTIQGFAGYELGKPVHRKDSVVSKYDIHNALDRLLGDDDRLHIYGHFGSDDPDVIIKTIRFLVANCGCKYIFLDHISIVVSGLVEEDERKALDKISTQLAMLSNDLEFALILVSHVNDHGQTRGSRNISKVAHKWIHLDRDIDNPDEEERNTTYVKVKKNRGGHETGPGGALYFDPETYLLTEKTDEQGGIKLPPV